MEDAKFQKKNYTGEVMDLNPMAGAQGFANEGNVVGNKWSQTGEERNGGSGEEIKHKRIRTEYDPGKKGSRGDRIAIAFPRKARFLCLLRFYCECIDERGGKSGRGGKNT